MTNDPLLPNLWIICGSVSFDYPQVLPVILDHEVGDDGAIPRKRNSQADGAGVCVLNAGIFGWPGAVLQRYVSR